MTLEMHPPTENTLAPSNSGHQITQSFKIVKPPNESLRLRFKVNYFVKSKAVNEVGEYSALNI